MSLAVSTIMSGGTIFLLVLIGLVILSSISFFYGFKMGVRAERTNWDLRQMVNKKNNDKPSKEVQLSELEVAINEQLGFWQNEMDNVDSEFCEKYMKTLQHLRLHVNRIKRNSAKKWEKMKPIWENMDFERVTMNTCLNYDLCRSKVIEDLKNLLEVAGSNTSVVTWAH